MARVPSETERQSQRYEREGTPGQVSQSKEVTRADSADQATKSQLHSWSLRQESTARLR